MCNISLFPADVRDTVADRVRKAIGGGQVQNGPFTFCLLLYADPALQPSAAHPSFMTDIPEVGWAGIWVYTGEAISGKTTESYGVEPGEITPTVGYSHIKPGMWGGRFGGGVLLPNHSHPGDRIRLGIQMSTPGGAYGAQLSFVLTRQGVRDIVVSRLGR